MEVAGVSASAYATGMSALVEDEQELGAACIDLGAGVSGVSIFMKKHMIYADSVRMGGALVTSDISQGLQVDFNTAERLKTIHGGVQATSMDDREMIEIGGNTGDWDKDRRTISRSELIGIMRPRIEEILEHVRARLDAAGFSHLPSQQVVLTGGGAQVPGIDGLAARIFGQQVRLGRPVRVRGLPQAASGPAFSSAGWTVRAGDASARRMVGFRPADPELPGTVAEARCEVVPRQLVTAIYMGVMEMRQFYNKIGADLVEKRDFFDDLCGQDL